MVDTPSAVAVFLAGAVTILTPCCLPMIPPLLAGSVGHRLKPLYIVAGSITSFTALGATTAAIGGLTPESFRLPFTIAMIAFGAVMADDDLNAVYSRYASRLAGTATEATTVLDEEQHPVANPFVLGLLLGIVWLPCVGPILGGVLAYVGSTGDVVGSASLLFVYGVGFSVPLLGVAYGSKHGARRISDRLRVAGREELPRRLAGYALVLTGVGMLFELDKLLMAVARGG